MDMNFGMGQNTLGVLQSAQAEQQRQQQLAEQRAAEEAEKKRQEEAQGFVTKAQLSPEQQAMMQEAKAKSEGQNLMSLALAEKQKQQAEKEMRSAAFARGYNPMAARGAAYKGAEARANIQSQATIAAEQEKAQALQDYSSMAQYQQQMQFAGEQAKKNFLLGKGELVQQQQASMQTYQAALQEIEARRKAAAAARDTQLYSSLLSGAATVGATMATGNPMAGMAAGTATNALFQGMR